MGVFDVRLFACYGWILYFARYSLNGLTVKKVSTAMLTERASIDTNTMRLRF